MGPAPDDLLVEGATLFDGRRFLTGRRLLVVGGRIAAIGVRVSPPEGTPVVDARGATVLPGLVDAHVHVAPGALGAAVRCGVTTVLDMFAAPALVRSLREQAATDPGSADLRSAGTGATAPGGHPTRLVDLGLLAPFPTLAHPADAEDFVAARVAEGSAWLKVVLEDGAATGHPCPTLSADTVRALVAAAHDRGLLVVAHALTEAAALEALDAGVDGLAHLFLDGPASLRFLEAAARPGVFVIPTLTSLAARAGAGRGRALAADPDLAPRLDAGQRASLGAGFPARAGSRTGLDGALRTAGELHRAGVPLLAGTDAASPGTAHGASLHDELDLLVRAGLTPDAALAAATSTPATVFGLPDRGVLTPGARADLVLVRGDPRQDITRTRAVEAVWRAGRRAPAPDPVTGTRASARGGRAWASGPDAGAGPPVRG